MSLRKQLESSVPSMEEQASAVVGVEYLRD